MINNRLIVQATFKYKSDRMNTVLLNDVMVDGELFREHTWVTHMGGMDKFDCGDVITFNASYHTYVGLDSNEKYVQKKGFKAISNLQKCVLTN